MSFMFFIGIVSAVVFLPAALGRRQDFGPSSLRPVFGHVLIVGAGQMGGGIAQVVAGSGRRVSLSTLRRAPSSGASRRCA